MQKLLFIFYGIYLAETGKPPFTDDTPKAWPHGPVFPRVNIRYVPKNIPESLTEGEKEMYKSDAFALQLADKIVRRFHNVSAYNLSEWSHQKGSPWHIAIFGRDGANTDIKWNKQIDNADIQSYFKGWKNQIDNH